MNTTIFFSCKGWPKQYSRRSCRPFFAALALFGAALIVFSSPALAQEMRQLDRIMTPLLQEQTLPDGARIVRPAQPVERERVDSAVQDFSAKWNTPQFAEQFSEAYYDKSRLHDSMLTEVPIGADMRLMSLGSTQTLEQAEISTPDGRVYRISTVAATARTQVELNDPEVGFLAVPGTNEIIFEVVERLK